MHNVKQDSDAHTVRCVNELLEILGRTITTTGREKVVDLVSKAGIVSMFHDGHELDDVVTETLDSGQHVSSELFVSGNPLLRRRDSNMGFVDADALGLLRAWVLELVPFRCRWIPKASVIDR